MKTSFLPGLLCLILAACTLGKDRNTTDFDAYLKNFEKSSLPIEINGCELDFQALQELNQEQFKDYIQDFSFAYQQIPSNGNYTATVSLTVAECFLPVLTTYSLRGEKIGQQTIAIGYCGSDCGYQCEEFMTIKNDFTIYVSDTISTSKCDSLGHIIPGTTENYVIFKTGQITEEGEIILTPKTRIDLAE